MTLDRYLKQAGNDTPRIERTSLKVQSTDLLRTQILSGRIPQGTRISEKELAELLGVSRMPARDALVDLEHEGLIVTKSNGRYVIQLDKEDIENLFQVRIVLERLAVSQAAQGRTHDDNEALQANLLRMRQAIAQNDRDAYVKSDLEAHQLIWQQARNQYLLKMLNSIIGPIFVFMGSQTRFQENWQETLQMHQELSDAICAGDVDRAAGSIDDQLQYSLRLSLQAFAQAKPVSNPTP
jgi:DNA-binding GntR family transcriptional regulator